MQLSQLGVFSAQLNGIFFTHMHNDHTEGFADLVQLRWFTTAPGQRSMRSAVQILFRRGASP